MVFFCTFFGGRDVYSDTIPDGFLSFQKVIKRPMNLNQHCSFCISISCLEV